LVAQSQAEEVRSVKSKLEDSEQKFMQLKSELDQANLSKKFIQDQNQALMR